MGLGEKYNNGLERLDRFNSLLSDNREGIFRLIGNIGLIAIIMAVFGCFDFVNWAFDFSKFITTEYWTHLLSRIVAGISSFNIGINLNWENAIKRAVELQRNISLYDVLIEQKDDSNFGYFVNHIFNPKLKRRAYINSINRKIHRLDKFSKDRDRKLYDMVIPASEPDHEKLQKELEEKRAKNKYCLRRAELEYLKSDEYINRNLDSIGVYYKRVKATSFDVDIDSKIKENVFQTEGNVGFGKFKASTGVAFSMLAFSVAFSLITYSINQEQFVDQMEAFWFFFLNCLLDAIMILWRLFSGTRASKKIVNEQLTLPYANRNSVLKSYIEWKLDTNVKPSKAYEEINRLVNEKNNTVEVELTPDQLKEFINNGEKPSPESESTL